ncbi:P-loop containing nucleoside triphosphate hydrolase protein, partial [Mycena alexandri]
METISSSDSASSIAKVYSGSFTSSTSISMLPPKPKIFHGRESELADILKHFSRGTPRIAILGAGGMGKTSLAKAALHHQEIIAKYDQSRFFVASDGASSKVELANLIGAHLGMKPRKDLTSAVLQHFLEAPPTLLILDNLETVWEPVHSRKEIEEFLSLLTDIPSLALMITMRGAERPSKVQWTRPFLLPLKPLSQEAARKMFIDIAEDRHTMEEMDQVLALTDNMPLSIILLAHVVDAQGCNSTLMRWQEERTSVISRGNSPRSNLELSISFSLASPRITSMPQSKELLSLLAILPDGLSDVELKQSAFPIEDILGCKMALLRTALAYSDDQKRMKALVPIREYMASLWPPKDRMVRPLLMHYHELLQSYYKAQGTRPAAFFIDRVIRNHTNMQNTLQHGLHEGYPDLIPSIYCVCDLNRFDHMTRKGVLPLMEQIPALLPYTGDKRLNVYFITEAFLASRLTPISQPEEMMATALKCLNYVNDPGLQAAFHRAVGFYYFHRSNDTLTAMKHCQYALHLAQSTGNTREQSYALYRLSHMSFTIGDYTAGIGYAHDEQRVARMSGNMHAEAGGLCNEALCLQALGDYHGCIPVIERA